MCVCMRVCACVCVCLSLSLSFSLSLSVCVYENVHLYSPSLSSPGVADTGTSYLSCLLLGLEDPRTECSNFGGGGVTSPGVADTSTSYLSFLLLGLEHPRTGSSNVEDGDVAEVCGDWVGSDRRASAVCKASAVCVRA